MTFEMAIRYKRLTTRAELETVFCRRIYFQKYFPDLLAVGGGQSTPLPSPHGSATAGWHMAARSVWEPGPLMPAAPAHAIGAVANITTLRVICQHFAAAPQPPPAIYTTQQQTMRRRPSAAHPGRFLALSLCLSLSLSLSL